MQQFGLNRQIQFLCTQNHNSCLLEQIDAIPIPHESFTILLSSGTQNLVVAVYKNGGWGLVSEVHFRALDFADLPPTVLNICCLWYDE